MNNAFVVGDVLLYFYKDRPRIVLLDEVDEHHFVIMVEDDGKYFYGFKIPIRVLSKKYFKKIDQIHQRPSGSWEEYGERIQLKDLK